MKQKEIIIKGEKIVIEYDTHSSLVWLRKRDRNNVSAKRYALSYEVLLKIVEEIK